MNDTSNISLGNCGTSKLFSVTRDNDCIVIPSEGKRKVVLKFLKNVEENVEVRFFNKEGNTYYKKFNLGNTDDKNTRSLLNVAAFLFYDSTVPNYDINVDAASFSSVYTPNHLQMLGDTTINLFTSIIRFMDWDAPGYMDQFRANVNEQLLAKTILSFNTKHKITTDVAAVNTLPLSSERNPHKATIQPESSSVATKPLDGATSNYVAAVNTLPLSSSSSSENDPPKVTTQTESSSVATKPLHGATSTYVTLFHPDGNIYYNIKSDGTYDINKPLRTPPDGGSHKRYRTTRRSRKYQSRRKSKRHIQRRKRTHRRKSRRSRK